MSNINFFRVLVSQAIPQNLVQCDIEQVNFSGTNGIYEFEGNIGFNTGGITASFESFNVPDRFELFWPDRDTKVADSLFIGDILPNSTQESLINNATSLNYYYYDPNDPNANSDGFVQDGTRTVNFSNNDISDYNENRGTDPSDGNHPSLGGGGAGQIGVMGGWPNNSALASNGEVRLAFEKTTSASRLYVRITGVSTSTAWDMKIIGCPNSIITV